MKKAFDTVSHAIFIGKLREYGIRDIAGDWIQSYYENKNHYCAANGLNSGTRTVTSATCGIPQGSCLGPLLFIIYLNEFEKFLIDSKAGLYADDTHITVASTNVENLIQKAQMELSNISTWMRMNKLSANSKKTAYMIIGHPRKINKVEVHEPLRLNDSDIKRVTNTKSLGIVVDEGLNWERQYKTVHNKSREGLQSLKRLKSILPQSPLSNVYRALIKSRMLYADVIWGSTSNSKIESLQRLQDGAVPMIHTSRIKDNWTPKFLAVEQLIKCH